jgi:CBS domain containing-hemolysin-like protein
MAGDLLFPVWRWIERNLPQSAADYVKFIRLLVETVMATAILLTVMIASKAFFRVRSSNMLRSGFMAFLVNVLEYLFSSLAYACISASQWILKYVLNVKVNSKKDILNKMDEEYFLQQKKHDAEAMPAVNKELFENALSISEVKLRECLIPRKEIEALDINTPLQSVLNKFIETRLSRIVVYENNIDNITGYVHQLDMLRNPSRIQEIIHPIPMVPESMTVTDLMNKFSAERKTIAWVVDEFGGTAGIVTMEDLLEELFGEIKDEYDEVEDFVEKQIAENEFIFSGRLELDHITRKYGLSFPEENDSETLSGLIIQINESIPGEKNRIIFDKYEFEIISTSATRIETVKVKVLK